jgi:hypothetical protein
LIHPFSIMEYWDGTARLDDFVYATADTSDRFFRRTIEAFFETYRKDKQRDGVYLLASDVSDPLWEAVFASPREMRLGGPEQLRIIEARVREAATGTQVVETLIRRLSQLDHQVDLKRLSFNVGLDSHRWSRGGRLADEVARLVAAAIESGKQDALLHAATLELAI